MVAEPTGGCLPGAKEVNLVAETRADAEADLGYDDGNDRTCGLDGSHTGGVKLDPDGFTGRAAGRFHHCPFAEKQRIHERVESAPGVELSSREAEPVRCRAEGESHADEVSLF